MNLAPGSHTIIWSLAGHSSLTAIINVSDAGVVSCVSVSGGTCNIPTPPGVTISNTTVTGYMWPIATPTPVPGRVSPCPPMGDIDGDGVVTAGDSLSILNIAVGKPGFTDEQRRRAALITAGQVTASDSQLALRYAVGQVDTFPICAVTPVPNYSSWVSGYGGSQGISGNLGAVGSIIDGYIGIVSLGYTVTLANVGTTIDYYLGIGG